MASINQPFDHLSELRDLAVLVRTYNKQKNDCSFSTYEGPIHLRHQVELQYIGDWPEEALRQNKKTPHQFFLLIRGFLSILRQVPRRSGQVDYIYENTVHIYPNPNKREDDRYHEYGSHVYVSVDGKLCCCRFYKKLRSDKHYEKSSQLLIDDVIPKRREYLKRQTNTWDNFIVNGIVVYQAMIQCDVIQFTRLWFRYGRELKSRFIETMADVDTYKQYIMYMRTAHYCGIYVEDRARLIMDETTIDFRHNHTFVMGGVFLIFESELLIAFLDNDREQFSVERLKRRNVLTRQTPNDHQIVMLAPVPSKGETICWNIRVEENRSNQFTIVLGIPLHGWRVDKRITILPWNDANLKCVVEKQQQLDYSRYIRDQLVNIPPLSHLRSAEFDTNERQFIPNFK